jgi:hypothetical protein
MATKAIKITNDNVKRLEGEFENLDDYELTPHVGYWMIVQFGSQAIDGFLSDTMFNTSLDVIGPLDNGWLDVALTKGGPV